jgi:hypothetical protein
LGNGLPLVDLSAEPSKEVVRYGFKGSGDKVYLLASGIDAPCEVSFKSRI